MFIMLHRELHPKNNINRLHIPRTEGELKNYVRNSCKRLLVATRLMEDCQGEYVIEFKSQKKIRMQQE